MNDNFFYKKSLGQNFLKDKNVIRKIVNKSDIDKNTLVVEIGSGGGALSLEIVPLCGRAILYETDSRLEGHLHDLLKNYDNYSLIIDDFLKRNLKEDLLNYSFSKLYVVANLPYYITTPIIMKFIDEDVLPLKMVVMVQKEVAYRLAAKVGSRDYGSLTVFLNYYYDIDKLFDVHRSCFFPQPNVDSTVISLNLKSNRLKVLNMSIFKKLVKDSFSLKRKNLKNNLVGYNLDIIESVLKKYGFDFTVRAEQLSLEVFVDMANELAKQIDLV